MESEKKPVKQVTFVLSISARKQPSFVRLKRQAKALMKRMGIQGNLEVSIVPNKAK